MEFRILGPLEVVDDGRSVDVGSAKQRALLAVLLLEANRVVSTDRLVASLWGETPPETAAKALQVYVSGLRKALGKDRIRTRAPGYELRVEPGELDLDRFRALVGEGRYEDAFRLWRGTPLADLAYESFAQTEIARLEELRLASVEERIERDLAQGRHGALVGELEALVREQPLRERLRAQLMLALYRSGRQAEALEAYQAGRRLLAEELGLEPGRPLQELQRAILAQDASLGSAGETTAVDPLPAPVQEVAAPASSREARKTVTVLACDVAASGADVDPESLRRMVTSALEELIPALERHGATVERSLGGSITAIFGLPTVHEDDALRAVRAADEMRRRLAALRGEFEDRWGAWLELRAGIGTGEMLVGGEGQPFLATDAPVRSALALHGSARGGDVLLDASTHRLVRDSMDAEATDGLVRLLGLRAPTMGHESRFDSPMVGRERERRRLRDAFEQARVSRSCQLFTILGAPGVGKSRLVQEFVDEIAGDALVARGRCLPYGEGITWWPVVEAVRDAAGLADGEPGETSMERLLALLHDEDEAVLAAQRLGEVLGLTDDTTRAEEIFWAVRTFVECLARREAVVLVFDDIHWGEPTFLELVDHVADSTRDAPVLLVCVARPELLDVRPDWGGGKVNATTTLLDPLSETESGELVANLASAVELDERGRRRIIEAAGGNPLFVEEMLALVLDEGETGAARSAIPPTIQALLAARLDRLTDEERAVIEAAAVEGKVFHESSVADLVSLDAATVQERLLPLARRELIRPDRSVFAGERAYGFRHLLIRDAAYDSIPKEPCADLHERHAAWLEERAGERALEFEEILGYHLERAFKLRSELGRVDDEARRLGVRAGRRLAAAGRRALARGDTPAALNLVSRAAALLPADDPLRVHVIPGVRIVQGLGAELQWAEAVLSEADAVGDAGLRAHASVQRALLRLFAHSDADVDGLVTVAREAIAVFEGLGDDVGLARGWRLLQQAHYLGRQSATSADAAERAIGYARRAEDPLEEVEIMTWLGVALFMGATPAPEAERRIEAHLRERRASRTLEALLLCSLAPIKAMQGQFPEARSLLTRARAVVDDLAYLSQLAVVPFHWGVTERLAGDPAAAERVLRASLAPLEAVGETSTYCSIVAVLAQAVYDQGRFAEAEDLTRISQRHARLNDVHAQVTWRPVQAKALARRGEIDEACALADEAIAFAVDSDFLNAHGDALLDLAEVLELAGRADECAPAIARALELYEQKGNVVSAGVARERLARVAPRS